MGMFTRLTDIINANINSLLEKAEDPQKLIRLIIQEMEETLVEVRSVAAKSIADKKSLQRQVDTLEKQVSNWQAKAELALSKGRDDLARSALSEKSKVTQELDSLQEEMQSVEKILADVQSDSQRLQDKLSEAKRRQDSLKLRQQSATVRLKAKQKVHTVNIEQSIQKFELYQQKVDAVEAQVEAYDFTSNKTLESEFRALETEDSIELELEQMKKKVANG